MNARTAIASLLISVAAWAQPGITLQNPEFLEQYAATNRFRLGNPGKLTFTPDARHVLFLRAGARSFVQDLWVFDVAAAKERVLLTADQILAGGEENLTAEELARRERMRMASRGIAGFDLSKDGTRVLVPLSGRLFVIDLPSALDGRVKPVELPAEGGFPIDPQFSPDAGKVASVRSGEVWITDIATGATRPVTTGAGGTITNGEAEFVAQEEMSRFHGYWWSPDSGAILYQQTDTASMETFHIADAFNPGKPPNVWPYPRAGKKNADVKLGLVSAAGGPTTWVEWDRAQFPYVASVRWSKNAPLCVLVQNRLQTHQQLLAVDPATGATSALIDERDTAWINIAEACPKWTPDGSAFLWLTEQAPDTDGWALQLRARDGSIIRTLAGPDIGLFNLVSLNEAGTQAIIAATGGDPTQTALFRVPLSGDAPPARLTDAAIPGNYSGTFSDDHTCWVRSTSDLSGTLRLDVLSAEGRTLGELRSVAEQPPFTPVVQLVTLDAPLSMRAAIVRPRDFKPGVKYPVIDAVYGGPGSNTVNAAARAYLMQQWLADQGFIVVAIDGRGTPRRGRAWERATKHDLMTLPLEDHAEALANLASRFPEMDISRVGVTGWSFGGYFAAHATMRRPDIYRCGVAGAPVADWADYDTHYTERYMGLPQDRASDYANTNALTYCKDLSVPLLIIHGTADDNVYFLHSLRLTDALTRAGRHYDFLPLSGFTHSPNEPAIVRQYQGRIAEFLVRHLAR